MKRTNVVTLWALALALGLGYQTNIAHAVNVAYRSAVIFGNAAATWAGAVGSSGADHGIYWNSADNLPHVHNTTVEYAIPNAAVAGGGGYATVKANGTPLTQQASLNMVGSSVSCANNGAASSTDCSVEGGYKANVKGPPYNAKCDGVTDDTAAFQAAGTAVSAAGGGVVLADGGNCLITGTVTYDNTVSLQGGIRASTTITMSGTSFTTNASIGKPVAFAIATNQTTNVSTLSANHFRGGFIRNIFFVRAGDLGGANASYDLVALNVGCNMAIENNQFKNLWSAIYGAAGYVDEIHVRDAYFYNPHNPGWQVHLGPLGDGHLIEGLSFDLSPTGGGSIYMTGVRGANIQSPIAATIYVTESEGVTVSNLHGELQSQVTLNSCPGCKIVDSIFYKRSTSLVPVVIAWDGVTYNRGIPDVLDNVQFISFGDVNAYQSDVQIGSQTSVQLRNCFRRYEKTLSPGDINRSTAMGIQVEDETATPWTTFNQRSNVFSKWSQIERGQIRFHSDIEAMPARAFRISGIATDGGPWQSSSATYYYSFDLISNKVKGPISSADNGEVSTALTNGGAGALVTVNAGIPVGVFYRFWRGTASLTYTAYVDIPVLSGIHFYDNGTQLNGYPWKTTSLPTRIGAYLPAHRESHDRFEAFDTAAPTIGTWAVQDTVWNTTPASGGNEGWVCTVAGSPGTWVPFGVVNNTLTAPSFSGTVTGTYTLGGTPTIASPTVSGTIGGTPAWSSAQTFPQVILSAGSGTQTGNAPVTVTNGTTCPNCSTPISSTIAGGETDAQVYTMPANTLSANGQAIRCVAGFLHAANANSATLKIYFNGTAVTNLARTTSGEAELFEWTFFRNTSSIMRGLMVGAQNAVSVGNGTGIGSINFGSSIIIKTTVTGAVADGDMTAEFLRCEWLP